MATWSSEVNLGRRPASNRSKRCFFLVRGVKGPEANRAGPPSTPAEPDHGEALSEPWPKSSLPARQAVVSTSVRLPGTTTAPGNGRDPTEWTGMAAASQDGMAASPSHVPITERALARSRDRYLAASARSCGTSMPAAVSSTE